MTDIAAPTDEAENENVNQVGIEVEMQRSYLDYAMSVIVGRALPDVRDGLKPVHRKILYGMYEGGYRPDKGYVKCSRVVGDVMGQYHPHGDSAIYDTLVRMAQPWSLLHPLIDGNGNFGSPGNDPAAAMRYCVSGDTRVRTVEGTRRIDSLVPGAASNSDTEIDLKLIGRNGDPVRATAFFHSGEHETLRLQTREGFSLTGTRNHPVLCLVDVAGVPTLLWKLLEEISQGDIVVMHRQAHDQPGCSNDLERRAFLAGAFISEGFVSESQAGFNSTDQDYFDQVVRAYDSEVGGKYYTYSRVIKSGSLLHELDIQNLEALRQSWMAELVGVRAAKKKIPEFIWHGTADVKKHFLRSLFHGDGSSSLLPRSTIQVSYSTRSIRLAQDVQLLLLELGIVSRIFHHSSGEYKVVVTNRRDARIFLREVGFLGTKHEKLQREIESIPQRSTAMSTDHVPFLAPFIRQYGAARWTERNWLQKNNVDRIERWENRREEITQKITNKNILEIVEPLVDGRYYYARVENVEQAGVKPVYSLRVDSDDHAFITNGFVSHNTECRLDPLAMELLRDIDEDTVDFGPNYDGRTEEPAILPSRFPNLLVNGSGGIAVGMATNIPPHNLHEVSSAVQWCLENPDATEEERLEACLERVKGPDFPTGALIVGTNGIADAYRTGRGSVRMRAIVNVEEDRRGRAQLVVTALPYQVNPDNLSERIAELVRDGKLAGIADIRDESSGRTGQRLVLVLKRDAVAKVVLNNLYKQTQLQESFGVNMLAIVDGVPRTLNLAEIIRLYVEHQIDVVVRRTRYRLRKKEERAHILRGLLAALDVIDEVIALIRASATVDDARAGLIDLLSIDDAQANAILEMQLRRLAALERQKITEEYDQLMLDIAELQAILDSPQRQRDVVKGELAEITEKYARGRRTRIVPFEGDVSAEELITEEDVVVTITRTGYAKRTRADLYRSQRRGGKGVQGATLKQDDLIAHFFVCSTHDWIHFFTNKGRVYRVRAFELPEANRTARGQHVANLLAFQPDEQIAEVFRIRNYSEGYYLVLATRAGLVKKTRLSEFDSTRTGGLIAINLRNEDELVAAAMVTDEDDLLLVSKKAQAIRFKTSDESLRSMGRSTSGVIGMRFVSGDELLTMEVVREGVDVLVATEGGYAKRTPIVEYPVQGRGGKGVITARIVSKRGELVGAAAVSPQDEVFAITSNGGVIRTPASQVRMTRDRNTMGVKLIDLPQGVTLVAISRNADEPDRQE